MKTPRNTHSRNNVFDSAIFGSALPMTHRQIRLETQMGDQPRSYSISHYVNLIQQQQQQRRTMTLSDFSQQSSSDTTFMPSNAHFSFDSDEEIVMFSAE